MTIYGFTGAREFRNADQQRMVSDRLREIEHEADHVITGACLGVDQFVATYFLSVPRITQTILVPTNHTFIDMAWLEEMGQYGHVGVEYMPPGSTYRDRNLEIVRRSEVVDVFAAFPEAHPLSRRSGTWQTARMARNAGAIGQVCVFNT